MKVLVADKIAQAGLDHLRQQPGFEVLEATGRTPEQLRELVHDVDAIVVRSASTISAEIMAAAPRLKVVGRAGVGVDNVDVEAATQRGVVVMNTPDGNTIATAELSFTHLLCTARPIAQANASMKAGQWDKKSFTGTELMNKTLGVLGLGRIGSEVAKRAKAFGMRVLAFDPYVTRERAQALEVDPVDIDTLLREADFITIHMPRTEATANLLNAAAFAKMKRGVRLVNCARGGLVNEEDLVEALRRGQVAAVGLDVFSAEPLPADSPLRQFPNVVLTPHLGASTAEAQEGVGLQVAEQIAEMLQGGMVRNAVNMPSVDPAMLAVLKPYLTLGQMLGTVLQQIAPAEVAKLGITYQGKIVDLDALPLTRSIQRGWLRRIKGTNVNDVNAPHHLRHMGIEVRVTKSSLESDYNELIHLEAITPEGKTYTIEGTLLGKNQRPRIVQINAREVEASPERFLLLLEHRDIIGVVGMVGTLLASHRVNIANMSLSRTALGGIVSTVLELDGPPGEEVLRDLRARPEMVNVHLIEL